MPAPNPELQLANDFVRDTNHNIFLTGKAGTGKTTFLHHLKDSTPKRMIITAPTGVAAINAGGVTLHSFFQMPFGPFVPGSEAHQQVEQRRFSREKINIIRGLDLLVIDEISMVRSDMLDGVDAVLRRYKNRELPFGGVQLLMIGDLHQLSPVVRDDERQLLNQYYESCYFFSSNALKQTGMISIELKHIYRQSDQAFIHLLNCVRDNKLDRDTLQALNARHIPGFQPAPGENYITLTTHNKNADNINVTHLQALNSPAYTFQADIEGNYPEYTYPTAQKLVLKQGAQVMFVRNDVDKRYFNGKIGKITHISQESITVKCPDDQDAILVERVTWESIKYTIDAQTKAIAEDVIGKFNQYPLRLAWAITIHKSQGLTFERAIIDANAAFSHGQVYVALSRCKTFEGMVLSTPIAPNAVRTDGTVAQFVTQAGQNPPTQAQLAHARILYQQKLLLECFGFQALHTNLSKLIWVLREQSHLIQFSGVEVVEAMQKQTFEEVVNVGEKFKRQMQSLFNETAPEEHAQLQQRVQKGVVYFTDKLQSGVIQWAENFRFGTDNKDIRKQINKALDFLHRTLSIKTAGLTSCQTGFATGTYLSAIAQAQIEITTQTAKSSAPDYTDADVEHPELFRTLKKWRAEQAEEENVALYQILHQRVLIQIAIVLPDTLPALCKVKGIGKRLAERYGDNLIAMVSAYCKKHDVAPQQAPPKEAEAKPAKVGNNTQQISYELYKQGKNMQQIAQQRGFAISTIESHLAHYVALGELQVSEFLTEEKIAVIEAALEEKGQALGEIKAYLGEEYSYGEIKMVLNALKQKNTTADDRH